MNIVQQPGVAMNVLPKRAGVVAAALALSACVYASPYSTAFPDPTATTANGRRVRAASAAVVCQQAHEAPGSSAAVYACLRARGRDWDVRGHAIRRQASVVGQAAIPLGIASLGLSAAEDRSDFVPLTAGVTTTALAHTGAYARPDQARVYEMATAAYRCLESAVGEWNSADQSEMDTLLISLDEAAISALRYLDTAGAVQRIDEVERNASKAEVRRQIAAARVARNRMGGEIGSELLRQSGVIEDQVREAIGARMPDPQVVAASLVGPGATEPVEIPASTPEPPGSGDQAAAEARTAAEAAQREADAAALIASGLASQPIPLTAPPQEKSRLEAQSRIAIDSANRLAERARRLADEAARLAAEAEAQRNVEQAVADRMEAVNGLAAEFEAAANKYAETAAPIRVNCVFNPVAVPGLGDPGDVTLNDAYEGSFLMQGGVPPYGYHVLPRDGLSITVQPLGTGWRFDLKATADSTGPWTIYVNDSSSVNGMTEVTVTKKSAASP